MLVAIHTEDAFKWRDHDPTRYLTGDIAFEYNSYYAKSEKVEVKPEFEGDLRLVGLREGHQGWTGAFFRSTTTDVRYYITMREFAGLIARMKDGILSGRFKHRKQGTTQLISVVEED